jgi:hypothetical protein
MILPAVRDLRLVTIRRGGTLPDSDHRLLALWAASCAEHVLHLFESAHPEDQRPRQAIEGARAWVRGEVTMMESRAAGGHAMGAARDKRGAARNAACAAGQAGAVGTSQPTNSVRRLCDQGRPCCRAGKRGRGRPKPSDHLAGCWTVLVVARHAGEGRFGHLDRAGRLLTIRSDSCG